MSGFPIRSTGCPASGDGHIGRGGGSWSFIPDFVPVLGYIDDLILLPVGILLVVWLTPKNIREAAARTAMAKQTRPIARSGWFAAIVIVAIWLTLGYFALTAFVGSTRTGSSAGA